MTSIERDRQRQGPRRGDEALAIPGYRHGFAISVRRHAPHGHRRAGNRQHPRRAHSPV